MNLSASKKFGDGLKLGLVLGVSLGTLRLLWFLIAENYQLTEIRYAGFNLLYTSLDQFVLVAVLTSLIFTFFWRFYDRLEGLVIAGLISGLVFLPLTYFINVRYLPGFREPTSLIGNTLLAVSALGIAILLLKYWTKDRRFIPFLTRRFLVWPALVFYVLVMLGYRVQPEARQLHHAPSSLDALVEVLDLEYVKRKVGVTNGIDPGLLLKRYYTTLLSEREELLRVKISEQDAGTIVAYADSFLLRRFTFNGVSRTLAKEIEWRQNPTSDKAWLFALNRQEWIWEIAAAYSLTQDPKYLQGFEEILRSWFKQNPRLDWKNEEDPVWRLMETSLRMSASWIDAFTVFFLAEDFPEDLKWRMLGSFNEHAQFLAHFRSPGKNHLMQESYGLIALAGAFPEFKMANRWLDIAATRLERTLAEEIYPDGGYLEGSTFYHRFVIRILQQIVDFSNEYAVQLPQSIHTHLEHLYTFLMQVARPDGVMPQMNDGFSAKDLRPLYHKPAVEYDREDFEFFASAGLKGTEPARSVGFPYSGTYVMRSDWQKDARYMIIDAGLFGSAHGHEDMLSFELFAYGKPFIVESGTFTYSYNSWHRYFESSFAHNTIVVDRRSQLRQPDMRNWAHSPPQELPNIWYSGKVLDYLEATYNQGYGNRKEDVLQGVAHTRRVLFVKPDYWIIWDVVDGSGERVANQLFHLHPNASVEIQDGAGVRIKQENGSQLFLKALSPNDVHLTHSNGAETPIRGWVSPRYGLKLRATTLDFQATGTLPIVFVNVLYPAKADTSGPVDVQLSRVSTEAGLRPLSAAIAVQVQSSKSRDMIVIAPGESGQKEAKGVRTTHELFLRRQPASETGELLEAGIENLRTVHEP